MYLYHYVRLEVDSLKTSTMLGRVPEVGDHGNTLSCLLAPVSKNSIDKLRKAGFKLWNGDLYLYKFDLKDVTFKEGGYSSLPLPWDLDDIYDNAPSSVYGKIKEDLIGLPWVFNKRQLREWYNKYKVLYDNNDKYVNLQIATYKYTKYKKRKDDIINSYATSIPHLMLKITKPVTKITLVGKF